jgi:hypothetical protein
VSPAGGKNDAEAPDGVRYQVTARPAVWRNKRRDHHDHPQCSQADPRTLCRSCTNMRAPGNGTYPAAGIRVHKAGLMFRRLLVSLCGRAPQRAGHSVMVRASSALVGRAGDASLVTSDVRHSGLRLPMGLLRDRVESGTSQLPVGGGVLPSHPEGTGRPTAADEVTTRGGVGSEGEEKLLPGGVLSTRRTGAGRNWQASVIRPNRDKN